MRTDILDWLILSKIPGVGAVRFQLLVEEFSSPAEVLKASFQELVETKGIDKKTAQNILTHQNKSQEDSLREIQLLQENQVDILTYHDDGYPANLKNIPSFPPYFYFKGQIPNQDEIYIGIVGSRKATNYGLSVAKKLARDLAANGIIIVGGMAQGIDTASHQGALEGKGRTIAVLGCGVDICYPRDNQNLMKSIIENGAVISEFPLKTPPEAKNFPIRNRIISGICMGIVIVEAGEGSGALITADYALHQGREVFAVPGNITANSSQGTNRLIKQGAKMVETIEDILEEIMPQRALKKPIVTPMPEPELELSEPERKIMAVLSAEPLHIDSLSQQSGLSIMELPQYLLNLELLGQITQLSGKRFVKSF